MNIAGVINYTGHGSSAQKSIWHCISMLSPFEAVSTGSNDFNEVDIIEGEKDFYQFIKNLYRNMYDNPSKYAIPTAEYDEYIKNVKKDAVESACLPTARTVHGKAQKNYACDDYRHGSYGQVKNPATYKANGGKQGGKQAAKEHHASKTA